MNVDVKSLVKNAIRENKIEDLLRGNGEYSVAFTPFVGSIAPTDWTRIMPELYKANKEEPQWEVDKLFETALINLLNGTPEEVYVGVGVMYVQIMREEENRAGFLIDRETILPLCKKALTHENLCDTYIVIQNNKLSIWTEIERYVRLLKEKWGIDVVKNDRKKDKKMTKEERHQHNNDLSNRFIPRLNGLDIKEDLAECSIQDLIVLQSNARYALEKGVFHMDEETKEKFKKKTEEIIALIPERVKSADLLYIIIDKTTKMPYLDNDARANVFSEKEFADEAIDYFTQQYRQWEIREVKKDEIIPMLGQLFYMNGATGILVDNGYTFIEIKAEALIAPPNFEDVHPIDVPVMNPAFLRALTMLEQERLWNVSYPNRSETLHRLEDKMIETFAEARFLVPVKGIPKAEEGHRNIILKEHTEFSIPSLSNGNNYATPVFTDGDQFTKVYSKKEWDGWIWTAEDLLQAPEESVVINVEEIAFVMSRVMMEQILNIYKREILPRKKVRDSSVINQEILKRVLNGAKVPHNTSHPVLHQENGKYYLAAFVFFYTKEDIEAGAVSRPTMWVLADVNTGAIIEERQTKEIDFSDASYDVKYNVRSDAQYDTSKKYYDDAFAILDEVRRKLFLDGVLDKELYQRYLDMLLANIPEEYKRFYTDLSV